MVGNWKLRLIKFSDGHDKTSSNVAVNFSDCHFMVYWAFLFFSTLFLLKIFPVSKKVHTTRARATGVLTLGKSQIVSDITILTDLLRPAFFFLRFVGGFWPSRLATAICIRPLMLPEVCEEQIANIPASTRLTEYGEKNDGLNG